MNKKLALILILGFLLRVILTINTPFSDGPAFRYWGLYLQDHSLGTLFKLLPNGYTPYPPFYYYILYILGFIVRNLRLESSWFLTEVVFRLPFYLANIGSAVLIFFIAKKLFNEKKALFSAAFFL